MSDVKCIDLDNYHFGFRFEDGFITVVRINKKDPTDTSIFESLTEEEIREKFGFSFVNRKVFVHCTTLGGTKVNKPYL